MSRHPSVSPGSIRRPSHTAVTVPDPSVTTASIAGTPSRGRTRIPSTTPATRATVRGFTSPIGVAPGMLAAHSRIDSALRSPSS